MPPRTNAFQQLVWLIERGRASLDDVVMESYQWADPDADETIRETDIIILPAEGAGRKTAIECRDWGRPQEVGWIDKLIGTYISQDMHVVAVSASGFTPAALAKAKSRSIEALNLKEAEERDWRPKVGISIEVQNNWSRLRFWGLLIPLPLARRLNLSPWDVHNVRIRHLATGAEETVGNLARQVYLRDKDEAIQRVLKERGYSSKVLTLTTSFRLVYDLPGSMGVTPMGQEFQVGGMVLEVDVRDKWEVGEEKEYKYGGTIVTFVEAGGVHAALAHSYLDDPNAQLKSVMWRKELPDNLWEDPSAPKRPSAGSTVPPAEPTLPVPKPRLASALPPTDHPGMW